MVTKSDHGRTVIGVAAGQGTRTLSGADRLPRS